MFQTSPSQFPYRIALMSGLTPGISGFCDTIDCMRVMRHLCTHFGDAPRHGHDIVCVCACLRARVCPVLACVLVCSCACVPGFALCWRVLACVPALCAGVCPATPPVCRCLLACVPGLYPMSSVPIIPYHYARFPATRSQLQKTCAKT